MEKGEAKYIVDVIPAPKRFRIPREVQEELKSALGRSMIARLKKEAVHCPVRGDVIPFLICYTCKNFIRRVKGRVYCRGEALY
ncbi:MAG: hypothetical protein DRJ51_06845 [Thermoprotei archaeon]|nr:MAG: hypothetical protein DRJ51_06845 [Thermoprotei archaeon]